MSRPVREITIKIHGADGSLWHVAGPHAGREGVILGEDQVQGIFDAPVRQAWNAAATQIGGSLQGQWHDVRDIGLGCHVTDVKGPIDVTMTRFRRAFVYRLDRWDHNAVLPKIEVVTNLSGSRFLDVQLYEEPDFNPGVDPYAYGHGNPILPLRAGQPMYYQPDVVTKWSTPNATGGGFIEVSNPTDNPLYHKWILTRGQWSIPDFSWAGAPYKRAPGVDKLSRRNDSARYILTFPINSTHGGVTIDLEYLNADKLMIRDASDQNVAGQMPVPGRLFTYEIPPWTPKTMLPLSVAGAPAGGAMAQLRQPRRWLSAIGGE